MCSRGAVVVQSRFSCCAVAAHLWYSRGSVVQSRRTCGTVAVQLLCSRGALVVQSWYSCRQSAQPTWVAGAPLLIMLLPRGRPSQSRPPLDPL
eukprot:4071684-Pyramimonas_sp.AAC.1